MNDFINKGIFLFFFLLFSSEAFSQNKLSFGFRSAFSLGTITHGPNPEPVYNYGYSVGILTELALVKSISLRAELSFAEKGFPDYLVVTDVNGERYTSERPNTNLHYIDLPILVKFSTGKLVKPYFLCGGWTGIFLGGKTHYIDIMIPVPSAPSEDKPYYTHTVDLGIMAGPGLEVGIGSKALFIEARPGLSLVNDFYGRKLITLELGGGLKF